MKQYEKLGIDLTTKEGFAKAMNICPNKAFGAKIDCGKPEYLTSCSKCMTDFLFSEVPVKKVKRWETYNGDFEQAMFDYWDEDKERQGLEDYKTGRAISVGNFTQWLMEEIEVVDGN